MLRPENYIGDEMLFVSNFIMLKCDWSKIQCNDVHIKNNN